MEDQNVTTIVDDLIQLAEEETVKRNKDRKVRMLANLLEEKKERQAQHEEVLKRIDHRIERVKASDFVREGSDYPACDCPICRRNVD